MQAESASILEANTHNERPRILVVEDDPTIADMLQDHFEFSLSADTTVASSARDALDADEQSPADVVVIDYMLPDMDGFELIRSLNRRAARPAVVITGHGTLNRAIDAMRCGAVDMFTKPFDLEDLTATIWTAIEKHRFQQRRLSRLEKLRALSKRVIRERRQMRRKLELVCKDVVSAYRDLAIKIAKMNQGKA